MELTENALAQLDKYSVNTGSVITYEEGEILSNEINWTDAQTTIIDTSTKYGIVLNDEKTGLKLNVDKDVQYSYTDEFTLAIFNQSKTYKNKVYKTDDENIVQNTSRNLGETYGSLTVKGAYTSTIKLNDYTGFELGESSEGLVLDSVKFTSNVSSNGSIVFAQNGNANLMLKDVTIESSALNGSAIYTIGDLTVRSSEGNSSVFTNTTGSDSYYDIHIAGNGEKMLNLLPAQVL